jgi:hypothetical protein
MQEDCRDLTACPTPTTATVPEEPDGANHTGSAAKPVFDADGINKKSVQW